MPRVLRTSLATGAVWIFAPWSCRPLPDGRPAFHTSEVQLLTAAQADALDWRRVVEVKRVFPGAAVVQAWHWPTLRAQRERLWGRGWRRGARPAWEAVPISAEASPPEAEAAFAVRMAPQERPQKRSSRASTAS